MIITPRLALLHLSLCDGIGPVFIQQVLAACNNEITQIYSWSLSDWTQRINVAYTKGAQVIAHLSLFESLEQECAAMDRVGAEYVTLIDAQYPIALRSIYAPPAVLYYRGSLETLNNAHALAVIGSRQRAS